MYWFCGRKTCSNPHRTIRRCERDRFIGNPLAREFIVNHDRPCHRTDTFGARQTERQIFWFDRSRRLCGTPSCPPPIVQQEIARLIGAAGRRAWFNLLCVSARLDGIVRARRNSRVADTITAVCTCDVFGEITHRIERELCVSSHQLSYALLWTHWSHLIFF